MFSLAICSFSCVANVMKYFIVAENHAALLDSDVVLAALSLVRSKMSSLQYVGSALILNLAVISEEFIVRV